MNNEEIAKAVEEKFPDFFIKSKTKFKDYLEFTTTFDVTGYGSFNMKKTLPHEIRNFAFTVFENLNRV